jgi:hypothetical protein
LKNSGLLALLEKGQLNDFAVRKFKGVVVGARIVFVHLPEDRGLVLDFVKWPPRTISPNRLRKGQLGPWGEADGYVDIF